MIKLLVENGGFCYHFLYERQYWSNEFDRLIEWKKGSLCSTLHQSPSKEGVSSMKPA